MAITLKESSGGSYPEGWQSVTISKAEKGDYNGTLYYDLWFESYPDNLKCRVWETKNKDGEEFSIANLFRYSNPEILEENESDGKKSIKIDDSPMALTGKNLQVLFYKNGNGYTEVAQKVVPASAFQNAIDNITTEKIEGMKQSAERYINNRKQSVSAESVDDVF
tara:strand:- start:176 stop:670 length:495 start_codon:yes stop_codon:yes gene_type:complete